MVISNCEQVVLVFFDVKLTLEPVFSQQHWMPSACFKSTKSFTRGLKLNNWTCEILSRRQKMAREELSCAKTGHGSTNLRYTGEMAARLTLANASIFLSPDTARTLQQDHCTVCPFVCLCCLFPFQEHLLFYLSWHDWPHQTGMIRHAAQSKRI